MTRGGTRLIAVLAATALVALLLAACGSSDSSSTDSGSSAGTSTETSAQDNGSGGGTEGENDAGEGRPGQSNGEADTESSSHTAEEVETPLKVSGGGSEQFRTKGGDNSIQEYGDESDEAELQEAAEAVHGFFVARAEGDWAAACGYLSQAMTEQLEQLAASSTDLKDKGCASFLAAFTSRLSASKWREATTVDAHSLRSDGEQAFLIYSGFGETPYAMPLKVEDGAFKVGALSGDALG